MSLLTFLLILIGCVVFGWPFFLGIVGIGAVLLIVAALE
jgi:hypothetical protein